MHKELDSSLVMVDSRVSHGAVNNLSRTIRHTGIISNTAMAFIEKKGLL